MLHQTFHFRIVSYPHIHISLLYVCEDSKALAKAASCVVFFRAGIKRRTGIRNRKRNAEPEYGTGIRNRNTEPEYGTGIRNRNAEPEYGTGMRNRNWG